MESIFSIRIAKDEDVLGFSSLPEQVQRKVLRRGFHFTIMVVGESGLGKSTLINSLFATDLYADRTLLGVEDRIERTLEISKRHIDIEEKSVRLRMTVIDTPGYGESVNGRNSYRAISDYIDDQFKEYLHAENGLNRKKMADNRVHCVLFFLSPYGRGIKPLDLEVMRCLHQKVNVVPVIAKADMLMPKERLALKQQILADIQKHQIQTYDFPKSDDDTEDVQDAIPFAVVGSNTVLEVQGRRVRCRAYPWGIVEVENPQHSDFCRLRNMLICTHLQDLKDVTDEVHYENFRANYIQELEAIASGDSNARGGRNGTAIGHVVLQQSKSGNHLMLSVEKQLLEKEIELKRMQDMLAAMQRKLPANRLPSQV